MTMPASSESTLLTAEDLEQIRLPGKNTAQWLEAGTRLVWVIDPQRAEASAYRSDGSLTIVAESESLDGERVLPGLSCPLIEILR